MGSGLRNARDQLDHRKVYACWVPQIPTNDHKNGTLSLIHFTCYGDKGGQFPQCTVTRDATWFSHTTPSTTNSKQCHQ